MSPEALILGGGLATAVLTCAGLVRVWVFAKRVLS